MRKPPNPLKTNMHLFGSKKLRAKRANDFCKILVALPALLGAPRGPPGGGLLPPVLLLLISRALGTQIPNPGSVSRRATCEIGDVSPRVDAVRDHFATVS